LTESFGVISAGKCKMNVWLHMLSLKLVCLTFKFQRKLCSKMFCRFLIILNSLILRLIKQKSPRFWYSGLRQYLFKNWQQKIGCSINIDGG
jgi:hypothetical protein